MRKITVAITAAALALSMLAQAIPAAAAVTGYDSAYAGESAFVNLAPGQSNTFQVFFANTGTTTWTKGTATQVDLAACLDDKVTCNAQDATEASWNSGWLSATRYATTTQTSVAPGSIGTFSYTVAAPAGVAAGTYRFNGALVLASSGADIHNEGYYQDATVGTSAGAAAITSLTPNSGSTNGGTSITVAGSGFTCTPAFPTVAFGTNNGAVTSCGTSQLTVTSPASTTGTGNVTVTVTNSGAPASNGLTYTYVDTTPPTLTAISAQGNTITTTWSEPVCRRSGAGNVWAAGDWTISINGTTTASNGDTAPQAAAAPPTVPTNCATTFDVTSPTAFVNGDQVSLTLNAAGAAKFQDASTTANAPVAQTKGPVTAVGDTTKPQISSAVSQANGTDLKLTYTEPVTCASGAAAGAQFSATPTGGAAVTGTTAACTAGPTGSTTVTVTFPAATFASGVGGTVTYTTGGAPISDRVGNAAVTPQTITYNSFSADTTAPLSQDARIKTNAGFQGLLDSGDVFTVAFNEVMAAPGAGAKVRFSDSDGTVADVICGTNATCALNGTATTIGGVSYPAGQVITFTMTADPTIVTAGGTAGLAIPFTAIDSGGITDAAGNAWNIAGSPDKTVN